MGSYLRAADFWCRTQLSRLFGPAAGRDLRAPEPVWRERVSSRRSLRGRRPRRGCAWSPELLEIRSSELLSAVHVRVIPGNPGYECGRLSSLQEVDFLEQELLHSEQSIVLVLGYSTDSKRRTIPVF